MSQKNNAYSGYTSRTEKAEFPLTLHGLRYYTEFGKSKL